MTKHPFQVRKQTGNRGSTTYVVVMNPGGRRVSTWPHSTRHGAQAAADQLNISEMVKPYAEDPRPYAERLAEAEATYRRCTS